LELGLWTEKRGEHALHKFQERGWNVPFPIEGFGLRLEGVWMELLTVREFRGGGFFIAENHPEFLPKTQKWKSYADTDRIDPEQRFKAFRPCGLC
jgi:hypothetical protein